MSELSYWLDKIGASGVLLGPAESVCRLMINGIDGKYTVAEQVDEGMGILSGGLVLWNAAKYVDERKNGIKRSPLVHAGRAIECSGGICTEVLLQTGNVDNIFRTFGPAALGVTVGPFLEYVAGPIHERFSRRYGSGRDKQGQARANGEFGDFDPRDRYSI
jgi:hypothetical protein